ncbi:MAG: FmdB family zinc ribbon protein [Actinomycetota bacterium]
MPIYEYRCRECELQFESLVSVSRAEHTACPSCGAAQPRRLMSVIAGMGGRSAGGSAMPSGPVCGAGACERCS